MLVDLYQCMTTDSFYNSSIPSNFVSSQPLTSKCLPTVSTKKPAVCKNFAPLFAVSLSPRTVLPWDAFNFLNAPDFTDSQIYSGFYFTCFP